MYGQIIFMYTLCMKCIINNSCMLTKVLATVVILHSMKSGEESSKQW